ncbi:SDR family NAD(P)-dependent oxidoreductase [Rhizobium laguerreae]|uniref:SDR family NAD(P)-dependent oxidoreductase n=1 Tax=Rhizobium laguerreae TaxID=1076926 RepID=UPI001C9163B8|nr:SDR family oxidoreductase [Rhizobium laguerreae]MBY3447042.1 SDR family oxidoreductase [Rhizobium laguerreae]
MTVERYALVTGANGGIGNAVAELLAERGRGVIALEGKHGGEHLSKSNIHRFSLDLASPGALEECVSIVNSLAPSGVNEVINCAAEFNTNVIEPRMIDHMLQVNVVWPYTLLSQIRRLATEDAKVILVSSVSSSVATTGCELYAATKAAVEALVRGFAFRYGSSGTRVLGVSPGLVRTKMAKAVLTDPGLSTLIASQTPSGRLADPIDIARGIAGLLSSDFEWTQGQTVIMDGGRSLGSYEPLHHVHAIQPPKET